MLNAEQSIAKAQIIDWYQNHTKEKPCFVLAGYAGTGKTFLVNYIIKDLELTSDEVAYVAPTGKAACVLIQRGAFNATTIHRLIYNRVEKEVEQEVDGKKIKIKKVEFVRRSSIPNYKLIILDETSMVEERILQDLLYFGIPVLCCGDQGQLPAIFKSNTLLEHPDATLTKIVRQSEDNAIIRLSVMARNKQPIRTGNYGNVLVLDSRYINEQTLKNILLSADQVLCGLNKTRVYMNDLIKGYLGLDRTKLNIGEKVICLLNNWEESLDENEDYSLVNGVIGTVEKITDVDDVLNIHQLDFKADFLDDTCEGLYYDNNIFADHEFKYEFHTRLNILDDDSIAIKGNFAPRGLDFISYDKEPLIRRHTRRPITVRVRRLSKPDENNKDKSFAMGRPIE